MPTSAIFAVLLVLIMLDLPLVVAIALTAVAFFAWLGQGNHTSPHWSDEIVEMCFAALVARAVGAAKPEEASKIARQALVLATVLGTLLAAAEQLVMRTGQLVVVRIVSSFGTVVFAAHQVALNVESFSFNPPQGFQIAATALTGQSLGAKRPDLAMQIGREARLIGIVLSLFTGGILFFHGRFILLMYTDDPTVIGLSAMALRIVAAAQPFLATAFILAGALRGSGGTRWPFYITMVSVCGVRLIAAYILAIRLAMGLQGAWIGMCLDMVVRAVLLDLRFRAGHWTRIKV